MPDVDLDCFYETIIKKQRSYCLLCLRTDTKFIKPVSTKGLLKLLNQSLLLAEMYVVCVWCEAACRRALSLFKVIEATSAIHKRFAVLKAGSKPHGAWQYAPVVRRWQDDTSLQKTNILIVDSLGVQRVERSAIESAAAGTLPQPAAAPLTVAQGPSPPANPPLLVPLPQLLEAKTLSSDVCIASILPDRSQLIVRSGSAPDSFTLHPCTCTNEGTMIIPTMNLVIDTGGGNVQTSKTGKAQVPPPVVQQSAIPIVDLNQVTNQMVVNKAPILNSALTQPRSSLKPNNNQVFNPINQPNNSINQPNIPKTRAIAPANYPNNTNVQKVTNTSAMPSGLLCVTNDGNVKKVYLRKNGDTSVNVGVSDSRASDAQKRNSEEAGSATKKPCQETYMVDLDMLKEMIGEKLKDETQGQAGAAGGAAGGEAARPALPKTGMIDFEDKIPMDVISFVDATDPHADNIMPQLKDPLATEVPEPVNPFGVISEVRSESVKETDQSASGSYQKRHLIDDLTIIIEEEMRKEDNPQPEWQRRSPDIIIGDGGTDRSSPEVIIGDCNSAVSYVGSDSARVRSGTRGRKKKSDHNISEVIDLC